MLFDQEPIFFTRNGVDYIAAGKYHDGNCRYVCHLLKDGDIDGINYAADKLASLVPKNAVLVPIPNHHGYAEQTYRLAKAIAMRTFTPVADVLRGNDRQSQYESKKEGHILTESDLGFRQIASLPQNKTPVLIDNCIGTGVTARSASRALSSSVVLCFAIDDKFINQKANMSLSFDTMRESHSRFVLF